MSISRAGALFAMEDTRWDHGLTVTGEGQGLVGHAGRGAAAQAGRPGGADRRAGRGAGKRGHFPLVDRGIALVSMAVAIALGATSMSDIAVLAHQAPVLGAAPSDTTVRRTLDLADPAHAGQDRPGAGQGPRARLVADRATRPPGSRGWPSRGRCWPAGWSSTWTPRWSPRTHLHLAHVPEPSQCLLAGALPCIRRVAYLKVVVFSVR